MGLVLSSPVRVPAAFAAQTNWKVVESLMKEVKAKTKRILIEKMGTEELGGGHTVDEAEENTLIATLADLIERIWAHAMSPENEGTHKSPFWGHLLAYAAVQSRGMNSKSDFDSNLLNPGEYPMIILQTLIC